MLDVVCICSHVDASVLENFLAAAYEPFAFPYLMPLLMASLRGSAVVYAMPPFAFFQWKWPEFKPGEYAG